MAFHHRFTQSCTEEKHRVALTETNAVFFLCATSCKSVVKYVKYACNAFHLSPYFRVLKKA